MSRPWCHRHRGITRRGPARLSWRARGRLRTPSEEFKMRLAVISDIHANLAALEAVLDDIASKSPDAIINLGDCVSGPLWPKETMELLEARGVPSVRGNHDRWLGDRPAKRLAASDRFAHDSLGEAWIRKLHELPATVDVNA